MKFNITGCEAKPGQKMTVRLKNIGELPKPRLLLLHIHPVHGLS